jgi:tetratricopeptide (TPR) repeat protein
MPVRPKHSLADGRPSAQRQFTDREDFIAAFQQALAGHRPDTHQILVYYGVGGVGKTSLRRELQRLIEDQPDVITAALDFDLAQYRDQETALFALRKELQRKYKVSFPTFDVAYAIYWQKSHPQTPMTKESFPLLEDSVHLLDIIHLARDLPFVGIIARLGVLTVKGGLMLKDWWEKRGHQELKGLAAMEPLDIANRLPMYWAADVKAVLAGKSAVICLDTYDALTEAERVEGKLREREAWVRELVAQLPEVLWVICGREQLRWAEADTEWGGALQQHLIGGLSDNDARQFLTSCGIDDPAIQSAIVTSSQGVPYFLDLAADTWVEIKERRKRQPVTEDFAHTRLETFDRFLRHLTHPEVETLKVLSVPRFWDYPLCEALVTKFQTGFSLTAFADLCRFSFISESSPTGSHTMHQLMRQSLQEHQAPELKDRVHRFMFDSYCRDLAGVRPGDIGVRQRAALTEAAYHGSIVMSPHEFLDWLLPVTACFVQANELRFLLTKVEPVMSRVENELGPEHPELARVLHLRGSINQGLAQFAEAESDFRRALKINEQELGTEHPVTARSRHGLAELYRRRGEAARAEPLFRKALAIQERSEDLDLAQTLSGLGALCAGYGRFAEAEQLCRRALAIQEKLLAPDSWALAGSLSRLGDVLLQTPPRDAESVPLYRRALEIFEKWAGPDSPAACGQLQGLAVAYWLQGNVVDAEKLYRRALTGWERTLGPDHPQLGWALYPLADLYLDQGRLQEAEPLVLRFIAITEQTLTHDHPLAVAAPRLLARVRCMQGRLAEAETMGLQALARAEKVQGPGHYNVAYSLVALSEIYQKQGRYEDAEQSLKRSLAVGEYYNSVGPDHPESLKAVNRLAQLYELMGRTAEARELAARVQAARARAGSRAAGGK